MSNSFCFVALLYQQINHGPVAAFIPPASPLDFISIYDKLGHFYASTAYCRVIHCPTINPNNAKQAHTRALARMVQKQLLSSPRAIRAHVHFRFHLMISKQTRGRAREWNALSGVTANGMEAKIRTLFLSFVNAFSERLHEASSGNYFIAFCTARMHASN